MFLKKNIIQHQQNIEKLIIDYKLLKKAMNLLYKKRIIKAGGINMEWWKKSVVYQIYVKAMQEDGVGILYKKYEELKQRLEEEGYFAEEHKQKIPQMPKVIGVLTSQTGSVIRDIINVSTRRNPNVNIRLFPVPVQGEGAAEKIAYGIKFMNKNKLADVLILARGGGSLEDLWPFNEEIVAHAITIQKYQ